MRLLLATVGTLAGCSYHRELAAPDALVAVLAVGLVLRVLRGSDTRTSARPAEKPQAACAPRRLPGATPLLCDPCEDFLVIRERLRRGEITEAEALDLLEGRHAAR